MELFILPLVAVICICAPIIYVLTGKKKSAHKTRNAFIMNLVGFFGVMAVAVIIPMGGFVSAADIAEAAPAISDMSKGLGYLGAALVTGMSCIGSGIAVAAGAPAAIGAVAEEPKSFVKSLIFVVLGEGIALYGLLISILIINSL